MGVAIEEATTDYAPDRTRGHCLINPREHLNVLVLVLNVKGHTRNAYCALKKASGDLCERLTRCHHLPFSAFECTRRSCPILNKCTEIITLADRLRTVKVSR